MNSYILTATLNSTTNRKTIWAENENHAALEAISIIMNNAYKNKESAWAKGHIKLMDNEGNTLREMEAK